jgi:two-component system cell cycle sensor histidine kinase/response regulator CckA
MRDEGGPARPTEVLAWLKAVVDEAPIAIGFAREGVVVDANLAYARLFGYGSVEELRGRSLLEQIAPSHRASIVEKLAGRARGQKGPNRYLTLGLRRDGTEFPFDVATALIDVGGRPLLIAFISDASEREDALAALRASEERFRTLSGAAFEGVFLHADGKILLANDAGAAMYGYEPGSMVGLTVLDLTAPESRAEVLERVRSGSKALYEGTARRKDGSTFVAEVRGRTLEHQGRAARVSIIRDVTEQRRAEAEQRALAERMLHAQKLESLGALAGGVAHDFNNILTVIANAVAMAKRERGDAQSPHLDSIAVAADRAADLCRQMLTYAGKATLERQAVDLGAVVGEMAGMLEVSVAKRATLVRRLAADLPMVLGDPTQIRQVVMNLVINASEAIAGAHGTVVVSTGAGRYGAETFARSPAGGDPPPGTYTYFEVRDDGVGMDAATLAQIFEPFFTTKFVGRGLGMAAVLGIVRAHAGAIDVESRPGAGTTIRVYFPATADPRPVSTPPPEPALRLEGVVLLVDDEANVRFSTQLLLEDVGMEVIPARDGVEALEVFAQHAARIGVVLLDLTMPRMDGIATLKELRRVAPHVPVVLTSGYGARAEAPGEVTPDATLAKPYTADALVAALRSVMRAPAAGR